jgi:Domain of unknown function (DUF4326)
MPQRIQLRRVKGWKMPPNTVKVDRTTPYGNPFVVGKDGDAAYCVELFTRLMEGRLAVSTRTYPDEQLRVRNAVARARTRLRGKNLACWCPLNKPCHADILLKVFNPSTVLCFEGEEHELKYPAQTTGNVS